MSKRTDLSQEAPASRDEIPTWWLSGEPSVYLEKSP